MTKTFDVAILGATGEVGKTILEILAERKFPIGKIYALASSRSAGKTILFKNRPILIEDATTFDFKKVQIGLFSAGGNISAEYAPKAAAAGCIVIDNTSHYRYEADIPLVIAEVNPHALAQYKNQHIIANPNCSTMQMLVALKPIYDQVGIERINVATYQAVSGSGRKGIDELAQQTANLLNAKSIKPTVYSKQIAFNVIPHIDTFQENGYTKEEMKMVWETQKILEDHAITVNPTAVRVPVFYGHSMALHIETRDKITLKQAEKILKKAPGVTMINKLEAGGYPTPVSNASGRDNVFIGRLREDISHPKGLNMWVVSDNVRKGAALNAVQLAELMIENYL
ncbi:MAG: Aspartate-semialdehyde dehydrogenase 2 [Legionellaceae bacterium]